MKMPLIGGPGLGAGRSEQDGPGSRGQGGLFPRWERASQMGRGIAGVVRAALIWRRDRAGARNADPTRFHLKPGVSEDWRGAGCENELEEGPRLVGGGYSAFSPQREVKTGSSNAS